jgi:hypothetical protein
MGIRAELTYAAFVPKCGGYASFGIGSLMAARL